VRNKKEAYAGERKKGEIVAFAIVGFEETINR